MQRSDGTNPFLDPAEHALDHNLDSAATNTYTNPFSTTQDDNFSHDSAYVNPFTDEHTAIDPPSTGHHLSPLAHSQPDAVPSGAGYVNPFEEEDQPGAIY